MTTPDLTILQPREILVRLIQCIDEDVDGDHDEEFRRAWKEMEDRVAIGRRNLATKKAVK